MLLKSADRRNSFIARLVAASGQIYVMNADGSRQRNLTRRRGFDYSPAWSSDDRRIAVGDAPARFVW
jgi:Tol biopolymer transport system component